MKYVGPHVSTEGGVENAPLNARKIGARAFGLFTRNQRRWDSPPYSQKNIDTFKENMAQTGYDRRHVLPHNSYLINIGSPDEEMREKSFRALLDEAQRVEQLDLLYLNFHPGSHLKAISEEESLDLVADGINRLIESTGYMVPVIETTAGQGSNLGYRFEQIRYLIDRVKDQSRIGVCIDTCHIFSAGYDIRTPESFDAVMKEFDRVVGLPFLKALHVNDSLTDFHSKKDRHQSIGRGAIGMEAFRFMMNDSRFDDMPLILETIDEDLWPEEIRMLYEMVV
jgi:deoxyribonuclease IV